jgi:hypothetical protein
VEIFQGDGNVHGKNIQGIFCNRNFNRRGALIKNVKIKFLKVYSTI